MWRRVAAGLVGISLGLFAAFVFGVGALETYALLLSELRPAHEGGFTRPGPPPLWFPWSHLLLGGAGLVVASRFLRRAA